MGFLLLAKIQIFKLYITGHLLLKSYISATKQGYIDISWQFLYLIFLKRVSRVDNAIFVSFIKFLLNENEQ